MSLKTFQKSEGQNYHTLAPKAPSENFYEFLDQNWIRKKFQKLAC